KENADSVSAAPASSWNPGELGDHVIEKVCGTGAIERARALLVRSYLVTTQPGPSPAAAQPASTVQFLTPHDLAFAKCDCQRTHACEHVVLAVWAFRAQPGGGVIELGTPKADDHQALRNYETKLEALTTRGLAEPGIDVELRTLRATAEHAGFLWL